jgi:hypothetical protein
MTGDDASRNPALQAGDTNARLSILAQTRARGTVATFSHS